MKPHPQADILRAIADGKKVQMSNDDYVWIDADLQCIVNNPKGAFRIKSDININGREIPCPVRKPLGHRKKYWFVSFWGEALVENDAWNGAIIDHARLKRGLVHSTKEAAIAHAEALLSFTRSDK